MSQLPSRVGCVTFNRTFMELKLLVGDRLIVFIYAFNRTFMELKRIYFHYRQLHSFPFNRTFMELKRYCRRAVFYY